MNYVVANRKDLAINNYVLKADTSTGYWVGISRNIIDSYKSKFGQTFNLIIFGSTEVENDYYVIPYSFIEDALSSESIYPNRPRWIADIKDNILRFRRSNVEKNISTFYSLKLLNNSSVEATTTALPIKRDIMDIAYLINDFSMKNKNAFSELQSLRQRNNDKIRLHKKPFGGSSINTKEKFAFHYGGRKELQFNIGEDKMKTSNVFRYGIAFALQQDRTLHNPKAEFAPLIVRFNAFLRDNKDYFKDFDMWYYSNHKFVQYYTHVVPIDDQLFNPNNFIFIGKYFEKQTEQVDYEDIKEIVKTFDYLMPVYEYVQTKTTQNEKRISRLCWNENAWIEPSGPKGKSLDAESHEAKFGYGHEEWLFDLNKCIDGYMYGFLEPVRRGLSAFENKTFDVWLYTLNGQSQKRYFIGEISNLKVIDAEEASAIKLKYEQNGWLNQMKSQIMAAVPDSLGFSDWNGTDLFDQILSYP